MEFNNLITLIKTVSDSSLSSFSMTEGNLKISLEKGGSGTVTTVREIKSAPAETIVSESAGTPAAAETGDFVKSPLVGTFYASPSPDAENFVKAGDMVTKGQVLGIIEAMKLMNEIECDFDGQIEEVLVTNEQMVEYGQPLFKIKTV